MFLVFELSYLCACYFLASLCVLFYSWRLLLTPTKNIELPLRKQEYCGFKLHKQTNTISQFETPISQWKMKNKTEQVHMFKTRVREDIDHSLSRELI